MFRKKIIYMTWKLYQKQKKSNDLLQMISRGLQKTEVNIMRFKVAYSKTVVKTILKYDKPTRERIYSALNNLPHGDVKRLQGKDNPPYFRIRIGDIRALFI